MKQRKPEAVTALWIILALMPFFAVINAVVLAILWGWFVAPLGVPEIGFWHAFGLSVLFSYIKGPSDTKDVKKTDHPIAEVINAVFQRVWFVAFALLFGWIAHLAGV